MDKQTEILKDLTSQRSMSSEEKGSDDFKSQVLHGGQRAKQSGNYLYIIVTVVFILALIGAGYFLYQNFLKADDSAIQPAIVSVEESQLSPTETVTPTPEVELDRADLTVQILNGSGTPGVASTAQEYLEGLGYENIDTGNADSYDYEETVIAIKTEKEDYLNLISQDLADKYTVAEETESLDDDSDFDVIITLGDK